MQVARGFKHVLANLDLHRVLPIRHATTMSASVDPAILEALGLEPNNTKISSHGGSGFASTFKLSSTVDGKEKNYFVKTGSGADSELMFKGRTAYLA